MAKSHQGTDKKVPAAAAKTKKAPKRQVQVVSCPSAFPISDPSKRKRPRGDLQHNNNNNNNNRTSRDEASSSSFNTNNNGSRNHNKKKRNNKDGLLDWHDTAKEIRNYGATAFVGKQKKNFQEEQYFQLTGRHKKKQKIPLPIVRGIQKAAAKRDVRMREEAKAAGIVLPTESKKKKNANKSSSTYDNHGPAPSVGFMKNGVLRVNQNKGKR